MILYFIYHWSQNPLTKSMLMWSSLVIATPIPNASILLSFPAKIFFGIPLYVSQIITSILSILFIAFLSSLSQPTFLQEVIKHQTYSIFVISILSSILIANIIDELFIQKYSLPKIAVAIILCILYILKINLII
jgi:branched-subunit amino acid transport protein